MSKIRLGIIGAGNIAEKHLEVIEAIDDLSAIGITSRTLKKAEYLKDKFGIEKIFDNAEQLIENGKPDGLLILVSADQIYSTAKQILKYGLPVLLEKPPGLNPYELKELVELSNQFKSPNMVGFNRRYYSIFHKGLDIIKEYGKLQGIAIEGHERFWNVADRVPQIIRDNWIYANSTHTIDLLRLFGGEPDEIHTTQTSLKEKNGDQFSIALKFQSGCLGSYYAYWYSPGGWSVKLYGQCVSVEFSPLEKGTWMGIDFKKNEIIPDEFDQKFKPGFYKQMLAFKKLVMCGELSWPGQTLKEAYETFAIAEKLLYKS